MKIIKYSDKYKEALHQMIKEARINIGLNSNLREDLYDINKYYIDKGDMFWLVVNQKEEVLGCLGYSKIENKEEAFLHRFYIKPSMKRRGIGTKLLEFVENYLKNKGIKTLRVHLGESKKNWYESYSFYPKNGYKEYEDRYMMKEIIG